MDISYAGSSFLLVSLSTIISFSSFTVYDAIPINTMKQLKLMLYGLGRRQYGIDFTGIQVKRTLGGITFVCWMRIMIKHNCWALLIIRNPCLNYVSKRTTSTKSHLNTCIIVASSTTGYIIITCISCLFSSHNFQTGSCKLHHVGSNIYESTIPHYEK